jgi:hypothetical protein
MGLYWYTMRKGTKVVDVIENPDRSTLEYHFDAIELGRFAYAYKDFWMNDAPANWKRMAGRAHAAAKRARQANPDVKYYVNADSFKEAADGKYPVYQIEKKGMAEFLEENNDKIVGHLSKKGHKYQINWVPFTDRFGETWGE